jgi:large subunit ribosomal protein L22
MEVVATAKWVRTTARKARLVAALVEGLPVDEAITVLSFTPRAAATDVSKVIKSAAANAEHNYNLDRSTLRVKRIEIESAAIIKRFRPRAQGRAFSIFKRTAHLRAFVADDLQPRIRRRPQTAPVAAPPVSDDTETTTTTRRKKSTTAKAPTTTSRTTTRTRKPAETPQVEPQTQPTEAEATE